MEPNGNTQQRIEGSTPNGGSYEIAYWQDVQGEPTTKEKAVRAEIVEYDRLDRAISRTYAEIALNP